MMAALCLVLMVVVATASMRLHRTILSPWAIYLVSWLGMIAAYSLTWVRFNAIEAETWLAVAGSLGAYLVGAALALGIGSGALARRCLPAPERWFEGVRRSRFLAFFWITVVLGLVGAAGYFLVVKRLWGLGTLITDPGLIRGEQGQPEFVAAFYWWKFLFYMNWLGIGLGLAWVVAGRRKASVWVWAAVIAEVAVNLALVSRSQMLLIGFIALFLLSVRRSRSSRSAGLVGLAVLTLAIAGYFTFAGQMLGKTSEHAADWAGGFRGPEVFRPVASFYIYIAANIPALQAFMATYAATRTYGLFQILPLAKLLQAAGVVTVPLPNEVGEFLSVPFAFNTYTYLNVFYMDWGAIGILIGPFLFGWLGNWFFVRTCSRGKVWHVVGCALIAHASLSSIGTNVLISTPQWEMAISLLLLALLARDEGVPSK